MPLLVGIKARERTSRTTIPEGPPNADRSIVFTTSANDDAEDNGPVSPAAPPRSPSQASRLSASPLGPRREIRLNRRQRRAMHLAKLLRNAALSFDAAAASFAIHVDAYMSHAFDGPRLISGRVEGQAALRDSLQAINFIRRVAAGQPPGGMFLSSLAPYIQEEQIAVAHPLVRSTKL
ncbi:hypothetical protein HFD88_009318 [Aspergillus terreus]|nr:hypothetical protein HFD88_009318 [Aspergillus terreus]